MKTLILAIALFAAACGGNVSQDEDTSIDALTGVEPLTTYASAKALAEMEPHIQTATAMNLSGTLTNGCYTWTWSFADGMYFVDVKVTSRGMSVTGHHQQVDFVGQRSFDPRKVKLDVAALLTVCKQHGHRTLPSALDLRQPPFTTGNPQWYAEYGSRGELLVDAITGAVR